MRGVEEEAGYLPPGSTVTITCSPRRGIEATLELADRLAAQNLRPVPHISARLVSGRSHLQEVLRRLEDSGLREMFVIGGDVREAIGPYDSTLQMLRDMTQIGHSLERIGVAAYPDGHPLIDDPALLDALADKQPFVSYMVTQICFDPVRVAAWLRGVRARGIELPVYLGIPGVVKRRKLIEVSLRVGVGASTRYITKHGGIVARLMRRGSYRPDPFVNRAIGLLGAPDNRLAGFHINTFNQVESTERWRRQFLAGYEWAAKASDDAGEEEEQDTAS